MKRTGLAGVLVLALLTLAQRSWAGEDLINPGFEGRLEGWSVHAYGAQPRLEFDTEVKRAGKQSLRVTAAAPSDAALGQELQLTPGQWYRFSGWVRTENLEPRGAPVYGTFQIQQHGGQGLIAGGTNHAGSTDWNEVAIYFQAPPDGRARCAVFFAGLGKGTGTAWFDDLKLERIDLAAAPMRVSNKALAPGTISPLQYGQFIEYLCDLVPAMWAEKLQDGSFEGLTPYKKLVFLKETDFRAKPWYPCGAVNRADYARDQRDPVSGEFSQKIAVPGGAPCTVGIAQDGIVLEAGKACLFSCYMRQEKIREAVQLRLHHEGQAYASAAFRPERVWKKFQARLLPAGTDRDATLTLQFRGPGTLWLDSASLMPEDNDGGWRRDVVAAVRALKPGIIRFGGSALDDANLGTFDWRDTLGDPDRRRPFRAWGGLQPTGAGLEEIVKFCRRVGAEPLICVRVSGKGPQDAKEQVQYFNGVADTPLGKLRAHNGHPEPYHIKYWQVGNERGGPNYEARLPAFCAAMKEADPTIRLLSSYPSAGVLRQAGDVIDYVCPHHYDIADLAGAANDLRDIRALCQRLAPTRPIKIGVTEWNTTAGDAGPRRARLWTLENALACARYHHVLHRFCDVVEIANRSNLTNSFCSGIVQTDNCRLYKTPTYYAQQLYATRAGTRPLRLESQVPADTAPDFSATLTPDGKAVIVFAVNATLQPIRRPVDFSAFGTKGQTLRVWTLADRDRAGEPDVTNSFSDPERITTVESTFQAASASFVYEFPALSLTALQWQVSEASP
jgi:alpha-N-arabinofuranosidase